MTILTTLLRPSRGLFGTGVFVVSCFIVCSSCASISSKSPPLETAQTLLGAPYCSSGGTPACFDCSGFVSYCYAQAGIILPRRAEDIFKLGGPVAIDSCKPGDLVFFRTAGKNVSHIGIMTDSKNFIHASTSKGVVITPLTDGYWAPRFIGMKRLVEKK